MFVSRVLHASCVSIGDQGVLFLGPSGCGKSDLSMRLIDRGAQLVADDQVILRLMENELWAYAPSVGMGMIELRGIGIIRIPAHEKAPLTLAVQLGAQDVMERLPELEYFDCLGLAIPQIRLHAFEFSTVIKIEQAMLALRTDSMVVGAFKA